MMSDDSGPMTERDILIKCRNSTASTRNKKQEPLPDSTKSTNQSYHSKRMRMRTYRTCNPRSSQTGFQSARPSPASTLRQTSTIMVVAVSMSKQHCALFISHHSLL
jgi:hypothetical protein